MKQEVDIAFINKVLKFVCKKLDDAKIDYYVVGAIGAYIDAEMPIQRIHEDLDIMVEEKCLPELRKIFENTDFEFCDRRLLSNKVLNKRGYTEGDHEVYAQHKYYNFHVGFFLFRFNNDSYTTIEYFRDSGLQKKLERTLPMQFFAAQYNTCPIDYYGTSLKVVRKEMIYKNKLTMKREKDLFDIAKLEPALDSGKLEKLKGLNGYRKTEVSDLHGA